MSTLTAVSASSRGHAAPTVADPPLVGRGMELARIEAVLGDAARGLSSGAFVLGHAGTGKSRLLAEAVRMATAHGFRAAGASCVPLSIPLPLDPVLELLRVLGDPIERLDPRSPEELFGPAVDRLVR